MKRNLTLVMLTIMSLLSVYCRAEERIALKSNLLYDALLSPNLGIEIGIAPKWSLEVSGNYNNWSVNDHLWKHWFVQPEARYWLCERFGGHYFALHAIAGEFNFGNLKNSVKFLGSDFSGLSDKRYQGWGAGAGVGYGYTWMLSKHWSFEAEIGVGWIYSKYDVYPCAKCGRRLEEGQTHNYVGPTKAALNIIYVF